jgi:MFS family permease
MAAATNSETGGVMPSPAGADPSVFAPLLRPLFRALWVAGAVSNVGTWVQNVGAAWLVAESSSSGLMVALVQAAASLPVFLLALPAGALADIVDRRRLLIGAQAWMLAVASALAAVTYLGLATPWVLLATTFLLGLGVALSGPAWQAVVPEVVPRAEVPATVALNSASLNLGRAVGPALGGVLVAAAGAGAAFLFNAASFVGLLVVLAWWARPKEQSVLPAERFAGAMRAGLRFVRHSPPFRAVLVRAGVFVIGGSGLWALLPVVTREDPSRGPAAYGLLLGCLGAGAVAGLALLSPLQRRLGHGSLVSFGSAAFALATVGVAWVPSFAVWCALLVPAGAVWLLVLTRLNAAAQAAPPRWVRARALAVYLLMFFGGMAGGSVLWGFAADRIGTAWALTAAACWLVVGVAAGLRFPLPEGGEDHEPSGHWPEPVILPSLTTEGGPVVVTVEYRINPAREAEFLAALRPLREARLRGGAIRWDVLRDAADEGRFLEVFMAESWLDHLRHHERVSEADRFVQDRVRAYHLGESPPTVTHLIGADVRATSSERGLDNTEEG